MFSHPTCVCKEFYNYNSAISSAAKDLTFKIMDAGAKC